MLFSTFFDDVEFVDFSEKGAGPGASEKPFRGILGRAGGSGRVSSMFSKKCIGPGASEKPFRLSGEGGDTSWEVLEGVVDFSEKVYWARCFGKAFWAILGPSREGPGGVLEGPGGVRGEFF